MLILAGTLANVYESPKGVSKKGENYGGLNRIQLMCENVLQNGEKRIELVDLTIEDASSFRPMVGKPVRVPVGVYVQSGKPAFYALKKSTPIAAST